MLGFVIKAQKVELADFYLFQDNKEVVLFWKVASGSTCNGISIWRSTDETHYEEIGEIPGVCGSSNAVTPYRFTDKSPTLNQTNYYKLRFGSLQFSEIKIITLNYLESGVLLIEPNPASDEVKLEFKNEFHDAITVSIYNASGKVIYANSQVRSETHHLELSPYKPGIYFVIISGSVPETIRRKLMIVR